jgi:hypothetical protein
MTIAAALASRPEVGSSMNIIEGFATSSTAIVSLFLCSIDNPLTPGRPTIASRNTSSSTSDITSSTNIYIEINFISMEILNLFFCTMSAKQAFYKFE